MNNRVFTQLPPGFPSPLQQGPAPQHIGLPQPPTHSPSHFPNGAFQGLPNSRPMPQGMTQNARPRQAVIPPPPFAASQSFMPPMNAYQPVPPQLMGYPQPLQQPMHYPQPPQHGMVHSPLPQHAMGPQRSMSYPPMQGGGAPVYGMPMHAQPMHSQPTQAQTMHGRPAYTPPSHAQADMQSQPMPMRSQTWPQPQAPQANAMSPREVRRMQIEQGVRDEPRVPHYNRDVGAEVGFSPQSPGHSAASPMQGQKRPVDEMSAREAKRRQIEQGGKLLSGSALKAANKQAKALMAEGQQQMEPRRPVYNQHAGAEVQFAPESPKRSGLMGLFKSSASTQSSPHLPLPSEPMTMQPQPPASPMSAREARQLEIEQSGRKLSGSSLKAANKQAHALMTQGQQEVQPRRPAYNQHAGAEVRFAPESPKPSSNPFKRFFG